MAEDLNPPSDDDSNNDTLVGAFNSFERDLRLRLHNMLPAKVVSYDRATNLVIVQPMIQYIDTSGRTHDRAELGKIPVQLDGGGGFIISYPIVADDLGWIQANDRDISLFLKTFAISPPNDFRLQDFSSAVFVPDVMTGYTIDAGDDGAMVIQSLDNTIKITLSPDKIRIQHPTLIETEAPNWNHVGILNVDGAITNTGDIDSEGTITGDVDVIGGVPPDSVSLKDHPHTQPNTTADATVQGDTGAPIPTP